MPEKILGESVTFRIEVEDSPKGVLLVFDRKCDYCIVPWQDAFRLAEVMEQVIKDVGKEFVPLSYDEVIEQSSQIRMNHHKGLVALLVEWTDRIRFTSLEAFKMVALALRKTAQDSSLELRGVHFKYDRQGMLKKIHNSRLGITQQVR